MLYSSHYLYEAKEIGTYIIAIKNERLALFSKISDVRTEKYYTGIRTLGEEPPAYIKKDGEYYVFELPGPESVTPLVISLISKGIRIREVKEMQNPLEELFE